MLMRCQLASDLQTKVQSLCESVRSRFASAAPQQLRQAEIKETNSASGQFDSAPTLGEGACEQGFEMPWSPYVSIRGSMHQSDGNLSASAAQEQTDHLQDKQNCGNMPPRQSENASGRKVGGTRHPLNSTWWHSCKIELRHAPQECDRRPSTPLIAVCLAP
jgi:hypothetical protein